MSQYLEESKMYSYAEHSSENLVLKLLAYADHLNGNARPSTNERRLNDKTAIIEITRVLLERHRDEVDVVERTPALSQILPILREISPKKTSSPEIVADALKSFSYAKFLAASLKREGFSIPSL
jgi:hypothetical protein